MNEREPGPAANVVCSSSYAGGSSEVSGLFLKSPDRSVAVTGVNQIYI